MAISTVGKSVTDLSTVTVSNATGDTVKFTEGGQTITALVFGGAPTSLATVQVNSACSITVGGVSGAFAYAITTEFIYSAMGGAWYQTGTTAKIRHTGYGALRLNGGTHTAVHLVRGGSIYINASAVVEQLYMSAGSVEALYIAGTTGFQKVVVGGGSLTTGRGLDSNTAGSRMVICNGGVVNMRKEDTTGTLPTMADGSGTAVCTVCGGGRLNYNGGNIDTLEVFDGGSVDMSSITQDLTITNLYITEEAMSRSNITGSDSNTVTVTNKYILANAKQTLLA